MENNHSLSLLFDKLDIPEDAEKDKDRFAILSQYLEHLIESDFNRLLSILYRIDVSEEKVRTVLANNKNQPSGEVIATLLIEREKEKIKTREFYKNR